MNEQVVNTNAIANSERKRKRRRKKEERKTRGQFFTVQGMAYVLGVPVSSIYRYTQTKGSGDPMPHCPGIRDLLFNPRDEKLTKWIEARFGPVDLIAAFAQLVDMRSSDE